jgi:Caspase domain
MSQRILESGRDLPETHSRGEKVMTAEYDAALIIGIAHYPWLRTLEGPVEDAERMAGWLRTHGRLADENVKLIVSSTEREGRPLLQEIDDAFADVFSKAAAHKTARRLYVYFAGHGCSQEIKHLALLMANANLDNLNRAVNATTYREALTQRLFPEQIYFFDCCRKYDNSIKGRDPEWTFDQSKPPLPDSIQVVLYAAGFTESANERHLIYSHRRGLFTEALLEGLNGAAAGVGERSSGMVTTARLIPYVRDRLDELTRAEHVRQHMWHEIRGARDSLVLATGVTPWRQSVRVLVPQGTTRVQVLDSHDRLVEDRKVAPDQLSIDIELELTTYTLVAEPSGVTGPPIRLLPEGPTELKLGG